jgi:DNA-binding NtrC family response regulator
LNELMGKTQLPLNHHFGRDFFLLLDDGGNILHMWYSPTFTHLEIIHQIRSSKNVFLNFGRGGQHSLKQLIKERAGDSKGGLTLFSRQARFSFEGIYGFYMTLPNCVLIINPIDDDRYLGTIRIPNLIPNAYYRDIGSVIYVDQDDRLQGFNDALFASFQAAYKNPQDLLGRPCAEVMSPTPRMIQQDYFKSLPADDSGSYRTVFTLEKALPLAEHTHEQSLRKEQEAWTWESTDEEYRYLTFPDPLDCNRHDFSFEVTFQSLKGYLPIVILGQKRKGHRMPDYGGYTFGSDVDTHKIFIKKYGYVVSLSDRSHTETGKPITYTVRKTGQALLFFINGEEYLRYYDFDFIQNKSAFISIGLRLFSSIEFKTGALRAADTAVRSNYIPSVVRIKTDPPAYYSLSQFYNESLSTSFPHVHGFILHDVTQFREDAARYQEMYTSEKERGRVLNALVDRFRGRDDLFLGDSPAIRAIKERADVIAGSDATVLIQGETGTGKEVLARFIHASGPFKEGPFVKVDCSTLSPTLVESELFGHEKGAFTGAVQSTRGKFEQANGGILFIDEINNLNLDMQAKILNFLQDRTITRVGGEKPLKLDLRIIIASNIRLEEMIQEGLFREDLYYRINIVNIELPPLESRKEDLPLLCDYFIKMFSLQHNKTIKGLSLSAFKKIEQYAWPGNVRELKNAIHRAVMFCQDETIEERLIEVPGQEVEVKAGRTGEPRKKKTKILTRKAIIQALKKHDGNVRRAAGLLDVERLTVYYNMKKYNIDADRFRKK